MATIGGFPKQVNVRCSTHTWCAKSWLLGRRSGGVLYGSQQPLVITRGESLGRFHLRHRRRRKQPQ